MSDSEFEEERTAAHRVVTRDDGQNVAALIENGARMADIQRILFKMHLSPMDKFLQVANVYYHIVSDIISMPSWSDIVKLAKELHHVETKNPLAFILACALTKATDVKRVMTRIDNDILTQPRFDEVRAVDVIRYYKLLR